jgi:hypothetical protein
MSMIDPPEKAFGSNGATSRDPATGQFLKGYSGGSRAGRKRGARAKFTEDFFVDMQEMWQQHGKALLAQAMFRDPVATVKACAGLMPREARIEHVDQLAEIPDHILEQMLRYAERHVAAAEGLTIDADMRNVTPLAAPAPPPMGVAPPTSAEQRAEAVRRDMLDQSDAANAAAPKLPSQALPHPVGKPFPAADHEVERINRAKLHDDSGIDPASLF